MITSGIATIVPAAMIAAYGTTCGSLPENRAMATVTGSVLSLESWLARRYSFTAAMNARIAVVNNAGICRDRMFASLSEADWDAVIAVHLKGHFCISSHAVHHWRDRSKQGEKVDARIINTSSGAGLNGSVGQSNYATAKGGIASLTLNQAAELRRLVDRFTLAASAHAKTGPREAANARPVSSPARDLGRKLAGAFGVR